MQLRKMRVAYVPVNIFVEITVKLLSLCPKN